MTDQRPCPYAPGQQVIEISTNRCGVVTNAANTPHIVLVLFDGRPDDISRLLWTSVDEITPHEHGVQIPEMIWRKPEPVSSGSEDGALNEQEEGDTLPPTGEVSIPADSVNTENADVDAIAAPLIVDAEASATIESALPVSVPAPVHVSEPEPGSALEPEPGSALEPEPVLVSVLTPSAEPSAPASVFLPGVALAGHEAEDGVDLEAELRRRIPEFAGGPSSGGISWHTLENWLHCPRKAYFSSVRALRRIGAPPVHFAVGTLLHASLELHYRTGGQKTFEPVKIAYELGMTDESAVVRRCLTAYLEKYAAEEAATWDVRGLEVQATYFLKPIKVNGRQVRIPLTCRHDALLALRDPGAPCAPAGPAPTGTYILDHKTARALTYDLVKGYGMDGQFLMNALLYERSEVEQYGPLRGVCVSIIAKHKVMDRNKSLQRVYAGVDRATLDEFEHTEAAPQAEAMYRMLADPDRSDKRRWPKNHAACVGRYGPCPYFDICDIPPGAEEAIISASFVEQPERIIDVQNFLEPPREKRNSAAVEVDEAESQAPAVTKKRTSKVLKELSLKHICEWLSTLIVPADYLDAALSKPAVAQKILAKSLSKHYGDNPATISIDVKDANGTLNVACNGRGATWDLSVQVGGVLGKKGSGLHAWSGIAKRLSANWWSAEANEPVE